MYMLYPRLIHPIKYGIALNNILFPYYHMLWLQNILCSSYKNSSICLIFAQLLLN